jgi:hypothetical protein
MKFLIIRKNKKKTQQVPYTCDIHSGNAFVYQPVVTIKSNMVSIVSQKIPFHMIFGWHYIVWPALRKLAI